LATVSKLVTRYAPPVMIAVRYSKYIAILLMPVLLICGCGQDTPLGDKSEIPATIGFCLAPNITLQASITKIEITVSAFDSGDLKFLPLIVSVEGKDSEAQLIETSILLPVEEALNISIKAFQSDCPVLSGFLENVVIGTDEYEPVINIELSPIQTVIDIRSEQDKVKLGETYVLEVYVEDASELIAFTCELEFDDSLLGYPEIERGELLKDRDDLLPFWESSDFPRSEGNRIALAFTGKADTGRGICGSGGLFRFTFETQSTGIASIEILDTDVEVWMLVNGAFEEIKDSDRVRLGRKVSVTIE